MKTVIVIPSYNEAGNIVDAIQRVLAVASDCHALVVDDNSPDGTADLVSDLAATNPRVHLLCRVDDRGLGTAVRDGFLEALRLGAELVGQMDADGSHDPADFARMAALINNGTADVVIGSRYLTGSRIEGWNWLRYTNSWFANVLRRTIVRLPIADATNGLRLFRRDVLETIALPRLMSRGYSVIIETNYRAHRAGYRLREIPTTFHPRRAGQSKMAFREVVRFCWLLVQLRFRVPAGKPPTAEDRSNNNLTKAA